MIDPPIRLQQRKLVRWAIACCAAAFALLFRHSGAVPGSSGNGTRNPATCSGLVERLARMAGSAADRNSRALDPIRCEPRFVTAVKRLKGTAPQRDEVCAGKH
jgi:hypothetical protein